MSSYTITSPTGESYTISPPEETKYDKTTGDAAGWNPPGFQPEPSLQEPVNTAIVAASSVPMAAVNAAKNIGELESGKGDSDAVDREITSLNQSRANMMQGNTTAQTANSIGATIPTMNAVGFISKASTLGKLGEGAGFLRQAGTDIAKTAGEGALYGAGGELSNPGSQDPNQERQNAISSAETGAIANMTLGATKYAGDKFGEVVNWFKRNGTQAGNNMKAAEIVAPQLKPDAEQRLNEFVNTPKDQRPSNLTTAEAADSGELAALQRRTEQQKPLPIGPNGEKVEPGQVFLQQNQANKDKLAGEVQALGNPAVDRTALGKVAQSEVNTAQEGIAAPVKQAESNLNSAEQAHTTNTSTVAQELDNLKANTAKVTSEAGQQVEQAKSGLNEAANTTKSAVASDLTTKERTTGQMANENTKQQYLDELDKQRQVENAAYANIDKTGSKFIPTSNTTLAANKLEIDGDVNALLTDKNGNRIMDKYRPDETPPSTGFKSSDLGAKQMGVPVNDGTATQVSVKQVVQDITDLNAVKRKYTNSMHVDTNADRGTAQKVIAAADQAKQVLEQTLHDSGIESDIPRINPQEGETKNLTVGEAYNGARSLVAQNNENLTRSTNVSRTSERGLASNETPLDSVKDKYLSGGNVGDVGKTILDNPETTFSNMKNVENGPEYVKQQVLAHVADKLGETPSVSAFDKVFDGSTRKAMLENGMKQQHDEIMALRQQMQDAEDKVSSAQDNFSKVNEDAQATLAEKKAAQDSITKASKDSLQQQKDLLAQSREEAQAKQKELAKTTEYKLLDKDTGLPKPPEVQARLLMDNPQYQQRALELANKEPSGMALQGLGESIHDTILHDSISKTEGFTPKYDADGNRLYYHEIDPMAYDAALDKNANILKSTKGEAWFNDAKEKAQLARIFDLVKNTPAGRVLSEDEIKGLEAAGVKGLTQKATGMSYTALNMLYNSFGAKAKGAYEATMTKMLYDPYYGKQMIDAARKLTEQKASQQEMKQLINKAIDTARDFSVIKSSTTLDSKKPTKVNQNLDNEVSKVYNKSDNSGSIFDAVNPVGTAKADGISDLIDKFNNERKPGGIGPVGGEVHLTGTKNDVAQVVPTDKLSDTIQKTADKWHIPVAYLKGLQQSESGGEVNPLTAKPKDGSTSAVGPFQFTTGTWEQVRKAYPFLHLPAIGQGKDPRTDPQLSATAAAALTTNNVHELSKVVDRPVTMADARLAHVGGLAGAKKILTAKPSEIAADVLPQAAKNNPNLFYKNGKALNIRAFYANLEKPYKDNTTDVYN